MLKTRKEKVYLILIAALAAAIIGVLIFGLKRSEPMSVPVPTPRPTAEVIIREVEKLVEVEKVIAPDVIEDGLNDMGVLMTEEYYFTEVVSFSSIKKFLKTDIKLGFTESSYLASYSGVVQAGIDFSAIRVETDGNTGRMIIHIPAAEIQNVDIDPQSFELYSEKVGLGNPISAGDFNNSLIELENTAESKAVERGLLERADENARKVIENFVRGLADSSVYSLEFVTG